MVTSLVYAPCVETHVCIKKEIRKECDHMCVDTIVVLKSVFDANLNTYASKSTKQCPYD